MKTLIFILSIGFALALNSGSEKQENSFEEKEVELNDAQSIKIERRRLIQTCWDEWGRAKHDCEKWGLCNFSACWAWQEPCCDSEDGSSGTIEEFESGNRLSIVLDISKTIEKDAISAKKDLFVDEDIVTNSPVDDWETITMEKGVYSFDPNVGENGGYLIPLIMK